jgi:hypothetical protein
MLGDHPWLTCTTIVPVLAVAIPTTEAKRSRTLA